MTTEAYRVIFMASVLAQGPSGFRSIFFFFFEVEHAQHKFIV